MKEIHQIFVDCEKKDLNTIIKNTILSLPKELYVKHEFNYYCHNNKNNKTTIILNTLNSSDVVIMKIYKNVTSKNHVIPSELMYLSQYHRNHYFYKNCYLAFCICDNISISVIKCRKADGDINKLNFDVASYNLMSRMISEELYKLHFSGYVHMDIKTPNIIYKKVNGKFKFGLCDFELIQRENMFLNDSFTQYYRILYKFHIPNVYTNDFEIRAFERTLQLIKRNKKIKANTI